ncbi:hypothetical protein ACVMB3_002813 [Sinorhizobium meliloti]
MTDRPILFSGPMIRALLAGRKTQTRRLFKLPKWAVPGTLEIDDDGPYACADISGCLAKVPTRINIGDRLWVRETWQGLSFGDYQPTKSSLCEVRYAATDPCGDLDAEARGYPWRPSIFMPRWASRLTVIVTDVRVERLQDISIADALAEGWPGAVEANKMPATKWYRHLWDEINGAGAWEANPWVAAYTFTVIKQNIDQIEKVAA